MSDVVMAAARTLGKYAARMGKPVGSCPYSPAGSPIERAAARAWVSTFLYWRPAESAGIVYDDDQADDGAGDEVTRHYPGRHEQRHHGRRYKTPGDRSSGLRNPEREQPERPARQTDPGDLAAAMDRARDRHAGGRGMGALIPTSPRDQPDDQPDDQADAAATPAAEPEPGDERAARIAAKEQELSQAVDALNAEGSRQAGTSRMRGKQHGIRIDAQVKRMAKLSDRVRQVERELNGLRRQVDQPTSPPQTITAETLAGATHIRTRNGWYEIEKVNKATVKVKVAPGWDNLVKIGKILEARPAADAAAPTPTTHASIHTGTVRLTGTPEQSARLRDRAEMAITTQARREWFAAVDANERVRRERDGLPDPAPTADQRAALSVAHDAREADRRAVLAAKAAEPAPPMSAAARRGATPAALPASPAPAALPAAPKDRKAFRGLSLMAVKPGSEKAERIRRESEAHDRVTEATTDAAYRKALANEREVRAAAAVTDRRSVETTPGARALANAADRRPIAGELTIEGEITEFRPAPRSAVGLPERPQLGRQTAPATQQTALFADDSAEIQGQGSLLDFGVGAAVDVAPARAELPAQTSRLTGDVSTGDPLDRLQAAYREADTPGTEMYDLRAFVDQQRGTPQQRISARARLNELTRRRDVVGRILASRGATPA